MYDVENLRKVTVKVGDDELCHYFADLRGDEWIEHQRRLGEAQGDEKRLPRMLLDYDARIRRVEGYMHGGEPLMESRPEDWREFIPGDHKFAAWMELVQGNDLKKN